MVENAFLSYITLGDIMVEMHRCMVEEHEVLEICLRLPRLDVTYYVYNNVIFCDDHFFLSSLNESKALVAIVKNGIITDVSRELQQMGIEKGMSLHCVFLLLDTKD